MRINRLFFVFYVVEQVARYSCKMNNPLTSISINSKKLTVILTFYVLSSAKNKKKTFFIQKQVGPLFCSFCPPSWPPPLTDLDESGH